MSLTISTPTVAAPASTRRLQDANYSTVVAVTGGATPAATFDLINTGPNVVLENTQPTVTLSGTIVTTGTLTATWYDSPDNVTFTAVPGMGAVTFSAANLNTNTVNGANAYAWGFPWQTIHRYVQCTLAASSAGVNAGNVTVSVNF